MGTTKNTAALYLRKSNMDDRAGDDRAGDNRSIKDQRHDLEHLPERHGPQIVTEYQGTEVAVLGRYCVDGEPITES